MALGTRFSCRFAGFGTFAGLLSHVIALLQCLHTVIETRVEVWENEKLKW